jgi:hypothetical protein
MQAIVVLGKLLASIYRCTGCSRTHLIRVHSRATKGRATPGAALCYCGAAASAIADADSLTPPAVSGTLSCRPSHFRDPQPPKKFDLSYPNRKTKTHLHSLNTPHMPTSRSCTGGISNTNLKKSVGKTTKLYKTPKRTKRCEIRFEITHLRHMRRIRYQILHPPRTPSAPTHLSPVLQSSTPGENTDMQLNFSTTVSHSSPPPH